MVARGYEGEEGGWAAGSYHECLADAVREFEGVGREELVPRGYVVESVEPGDVCGALGLGEGELPAALADAVARHAAEAMRERLDCTGNDPWTDCIWQAYREATGHGHDDGL